MTPGIPKKNFTSKHGYMVYGINILKLVNQCYAI